MKFAGRIKENSDCRVLPQCPGVAVMSNSSLDLPTPLRSASALTNTGVNIPWACNMFLYSLISHTHTVDQTRIAASGYLKVDGIESVETALRVTEKVNTVEAQEPFAPK